MTPSLLEAALAYAEHLGWYVFPLAGEGKTPLTQSGHLDATTDPATIRAWWTRQPDARIGVYARRSGFLALDVDVAGGKRGDEALAALEAACGPLPRNYHQQSGRGGQHILLADPSPGPEGWTRLRDQGGRLRGKLAAVVGGRVVGGIDVKCNGYIVVAPSGSYRWLSAGGPIPPVPADWIPVLQHPEALLSDGGEVSVEAWLDTVDGGLAPQDAADLRAALAALPPRGQGKAATYQAVMIVHHHYGMSVSDGRPYLNEWSAASGIPMGGAELDRQVERVARKVGAGDGPRGNRRMVAANPHDLVMRARVDPGPFAPSDRPDIVAAGVQVVGHPPAPPLAPVPLAEGAPADPWDLAFAKALGEVRLALAAGKVGAGGVGAPAPLFERAVDLIRRPHPPTPWLVKSLVKDLGTVVISGEPKTTKSWVATEISIAVACGGPVFGCDKFPTGAPRRVAYFYAEDLAPDVAAHLRALATGRGVDEQALANLYVQPRGRFLNVLKDEDVALVVASCRAIVAEPGPPLGLVVLDPLRDIHAGKEKDSDDMIEVMRRLRLIGELLGTAVGTIHHTTKDSADTGKRRRGQKLRGSGAIHGSLDSGIYMELKATDNKAKFVNNVESEVKGARGGGVFDLTLDIEDDVLGTSVKAVWSVDWNAKRAVDAATEEAAWRALRALSIVTDKSNAERAAAEVVAKFMPTGWKNESKTAKALEAAKKLKWAEFLGAGHRGGWRLTKEGREKVAAEPVVAPRPEISGTEAVAKLAAEVAGGITGPASP